MGHRRIDEGEREAVMVAFLAAHDGCPPEDVELHEGPWAVVCVCNNCFDLRTYEVADIGREAPNVHGEPSGP